MLSNCKCACVHILICAVFSSSEVLVERGEREEREEREREREREQTVSVCTVIV